MEPLRRLESLLENLVEEPFVRLFSARLLPQEVAKHLMRAIEDGERIGADGVVELPGSYRISLNPQDLDALYTNHPHIGEDLNGALQEMALRMDVRLCEKPQVILEADTRLPLRGVIITPSDRTPVTTEATRDFEPQEVNRLLAQEAIADTEYYLIIEGERTFDLDGTKVGIGRALDNELILEDRRISRHHAQLRIRYNRYILQDLGSSGGTLVNGFPVQEVVLRSGDVITLSGMDLVYIAEKAGQHKHPGLKSDTLPIPPNAQEVA